MGSTLWSSRGKGFVCDAFLNSDLRTYEKYVAHHDLLKSSKARAKPLKFEALRLLYPPARYASLFI